MVCANAYVNSLPWALVAFTCGEANVSWRSCSQVQDPFTSKVTITCMFRSHVHLLFTLGSDSTLRDCEYISLFWDRIFEKLLLVILIKVDVESSKYQNNISYLSTTKIELFRYVSVYNFRQWPLPSSEKYKLKLNPGCPFLFLKARAAPNKRGHLFDNAPLRHNVGKKIQSLRKP